jgi:DNA topoisomerase-1
VSANGSDDAEAAGLRYSSDEGPGISRRRAGRGFCYRSARGEPVRNERQLARIRALGIPPAWQDVWICPDARGHLQATGRDARGRKQYLYHADWRSLRDATKFDRMLPFGGTLPRLRDRVESDLELPGLPRERVLAAVVRLVDETLIRVGNEQYRRANGSFGATTMRSRHAQVNGRRITIEFRGKGGKPLRAEIADRRLARTMQRLQELPGRELFEYLEEDGGRRRVYSEDVNAYLQDVSGEELSVKDFRTWGASALCIGALYELGAPASAAEATRAVAAAIGGVATALGNTPAVCRASYVHPALPEAYAAGELTGGAQRRLSGLDLNESRLLRFLRARS